MTSTLLDRLVTRGRALQRDGYEIGIRADGTPLTIDDRRHLLIGGLTGTGKSSLLRGLLARAASRPDLALVLVDPKLVEFTIWHPRASTIVTEPDDITATLAALVETMRHRYRRMAAASVTHWPARLGPRVLLAIDELAAITSTGDRDTDRTNTVALRSLVERSRAAGFQIIAATQRPSHDVVPTFLRDAFPARLAFATPNVDTTEMILGPTGRTCPAHDLPLTMPGRCYLLADGHRTPIAARVAWLDEQRAATIARQLAHLRVDLFTAPTPAPAAAAAPEPFSTNLPQHPTGHAAHERPADRSPLPEPEPTRTAAGRPDPIPPHDALPRHQRAAARAVADPARQHPLPGMADDTLDNDSWAVLAVLRQAGAPLTAKSIYTILRTSTPFSGTRTRTALGRLAAVGYVRQIGPAWRSLV